MSELQEPTTRIHSSGQGYVQQTTIRPSRAQRDDIALHPPQDIPHVLEVARETKADAHEPEARVAAEQQLTRLRVEAVVQVALPPPEIDLLAVRGAPRGEAPRAVQQPEHRAGVAHAARAQRDARAPRGALDGVVAQRRAGCREEDARDERAAGTGTRGVRECGDDVRDGRAVCVRCARETGAEVVR